MQNERPKGHGDDLAERLLEFAVGIVRLSAVLPKTAAGKHVGGQLLRAGTSAGANYEEARGAESRADFVHKLGVALKELKESRFWLRLIHQAQMIPAKQLEPLLQKCEELCAIVAKSILAAKAKKA